MPDRRTYLKAAMLKKGMKATIDDTPYIEQKDFGDGHGLKRLVQIPLKLAVEIHDNYNGVMTSSVVWNAGRNAEKLLIDTLGEDMDDWTDHTGHFDSIEWSTSQRSGFAWGFIPDTATVQEEINQAVQEAEKKGEEQKYICTDCQALKKAFVTDDREELQQHMNEKHKDLYPNGVYVKAPGIYEIVNVAPKKKSKKVV